MGISRDKQHKHRATGGTFPHLRKKRKFELGRPPAATKLGPKRLRTVRCRGGNLKYRALRLDKGNFAWAEYNCSCKSRILDVVYNASNNELVRTQSLVKNTIVTIDATPFKSWYKKQYGIDLGKKKSGAEGEEPAENEFSENQMKKISAKKASMPTLDTKLANQFSAGKLMACISSRPGQTGRCDGYVLEGDELNFYLKKVEKKKK